MPEQTQPAAAAAQTKTKHGHAASQAQPAPRKVRFNVGEFQSAPFLISALCLDTPRLHATQARILHLSDVK